MRKLLLFCVTLVFSSALLRAAPRISQGDIILERTAFGGFVPIENSGWEKKIYLTRMGQVVFSSRVNAQAPWVERWIGDLAPGTVRKILHLISSLEEGEVSFPDSPQCADAPSVFYTALNRHGPRVARIDFAKEVNCRQGFLEQSPKSYQLRNLLDSLHDLAEL